MLNWELYQQFNINKKHVIIHQVELIKIEEQKYLIYNKIDIC